jgi:hypothetical protein
MVLAALRFRHLRQVSVFAHRKKSGSESIVNTCDSRGRQVLYDIGQRGPVHVCMHVEHTRVTTPKGDKLHDGASSCAEGCKHPKQYAGGHLQSCEDALNRRNKLCITAKLSAIKQAREKIRAASVANQRDNMCSAWHTIVLH